MIAMPQLVPDEPWPPYTYVPGRAAHPIGDPQGHSFGLELIEARPPTEDSWQQARCYLRGVDLLNAGFHWEAHESWEATWIALGRRGPQADFLKGLIKLAAAGVKAFEGSAVGVSNHGKRAAELFRSVADRLGNRIYGFTPLDLAQLADALHNDPQSIVERASQEPPVCILPAQLMPFGMTERSA